VKNERYILSILFVVAGLAAFAFLAWWLRAGKQEAMRPTSTDWPEWTKEWETKQREEKTKAPQPRQRTNGAS
jgi:hypothetical protein